jgi:hypothetical protein
MTFRVLTWDRDKQEYTPQVGVSCHGLTWSGLRAALKELRRMSYGAWRVRCADGSHDSDPEVLVEKEAKL